MLVGFYLFAYEKLKICFFVKEILYDYRIAVYYSIDWTFLYFLLEELYRGVFLFEHALDGTEEAYPAGFFIVVDIWFVANHLKANITVELFLQCDDSEDLGSFYFFSLL